MSNEFTEKDKQLYLAVNEVLGRNCCMSLSFGTIKDIRKVILDQINISTIERFVKDYGICQDFNMDDGIELLDEFVEELKNDNI